MYKPIARVDVDDIAFSSSLFSDKVDNTDGLNQLQTDAFWLHGSRLIFSRMLCSPNGPAMVSVVCLSYVTFVHPRDYIIVHPTQTVKLFGNSPIILGLPASIFFTKFRRGHPLRGC